MQPTSRTAIHWTTRLTRSIQHDRRFLFSLVLIFIAAAVESTLIKGASAHTIPVPPGLNSGPPWPTMSLYMHTIDVNRCRSGGEAQGDRSTYNYGGYTPGIARPYDGVVILDFGRPAYKDGIYQTLLVDDGSGLAQYVIPAQIISCVEQYAWGFYYHTPPSSQDPPRLRILIGTSNSYLDDPSASYQAPAYGHGNMWAGLTTKVADYVAANPGLASQITIGAANDIELAWSNFGGPNGVDQWYQGYASRAQHTIYNYGDAQGCYPVPSNPGDYCNRDWYQDDVWYVSKGAPYARAIPQIYYGKPTNTYDINAKQWQQISLHGYVYQQGATLNFWAELTQFNDCGYCDNGSGNTPQEGWTQLQDMLFNNDPTYGHDPSCTAPPTCHKTDAVIYRSTDIGHLYP